MDRILEQSNLATPDTVSSLSPAEIDQLPLLPVAKIAGVHVRELWRRGDFVDALIVYEAGATTPGLPHFGADHHIWVVSGEVTIAGRQLAAGAYVYVPPGAAHPINAGQEGCTLLQMHRPHGVGAST
jgi:glyoxylate utilization-related uncharacterized protein